MNGTIFHRMVRKGLSDQMASEQRNARNEDASPADTWGERELQAAKTLGQECTWFILGGARMPKWEGEGAGRSRTRGDSSSPGPDLVVPCR